MLIDFQLQCNKKNSFEQFRTINSWELAGGSCCEENCVVKNSVSDFSASNDWAMLATSAS